MDLIKELNNSYANIVGVALNAIIIIVTATIGLMELNSMKKARHAEVLNGIFEKIHSISSSKDRDLFFKLDLSDFNKVTYENRFLCEHIIDEYTKISYICYKKMIPRKYIYEMYSGLFIKLFEHSNVYIKGKQEESGLKNYANYLEKMYYKCLKYRKRKKIGVQLRLDKNNRFDLIKK